MNLTSTLLRQLAAPGLDRNEHARLRCELAKEMEEAGDYEGARGVLEGLWRRIGERPNVGELDKQAAAEVLLRAGSLSGWIGSAKQLEGAQETAKDLISESIALFEELQEVEKACEARTDLAICYWREGAFDEARVILNSVITRLAGKASAQESRALLNLAIVEKTANRLSDALHILIDGSSLFEASDNHALKGRFHNQLGTVLKNLGAAEGRPDYVDRALVEYAAASFHFGQAGNLRFRAAVENNLGFLFLAGGRLKEAHEHLDRARRLFESLKDKVHTAQVNETRARAFLAEERNAEAERVVRGVVRTLEGGDEQWLLAEALRTHGVALARLGRYEQAHETLQRACEVAHQAGDSEGAGVAALTILEELTGHLRAAEMHLVYERADELLSESQHTGTLTRLRTAARKVIASLGEQPMPSDDFNTPRFIYKTDEMAQILQRAHRIAGTSQPVLITGETGTGKEMLARLVHEWSGRAGEFVTVSCGVLNESLIESLLFGHKKGSFPGAEEDYPGAARLAEGGTLFLDEIAELGPHAQAKILRLIEHCEIQTIGALVPQRIDLRVVASTNRRLKEEVAAGRFRDELYYRLETFQVEIPPLRARAKDIKALAEHFIRDALVRQPKRVIFTREAIEAMCELPLEGNARELRSLIERTLMTATEGAVITPEAVKTHGLRRTQLAGLANPWEGFSLKDEVRRFEARFIELALKETGGKVSHAARLLGFKHHESLASVISSRHKEMLAVRLPVMPRRRSIARRDRSGPK